MAQKKSLEVALIGEDWVVWKERTYRAMSRHKSQRAAVQAAQLIAKNQKVELIIRGRDGRVKRRIRNGAKRPVPKPIAKPTVIIFPYLRPSVSPRRISAAVKAVTQERRKRLSKAG
jgi:hypothetical protein